ncbi:VWA domain-containing protein [Alicyclobacillus herbarius]|uniref:VWA domain-containing protein n=1 Tax=Alicyclobacillus herbarius TaxID=122960 RepID=UPI00042168EB|nr:VWA domain-containing protein [Alicyclobacillus herbarius]
MGRASRGAGGDIDGLPPHLPTWAARPIQAVGLPLMRSRRSWGKRGASGVDWRRSLREWTKTGQLGPDFVARRSRFQSGRLVVLWDVSASMAEFIPLYMPWVYALVRDLPQVGVFLFAHRLVEATALFHRPYPGTCQALQSLRQLWRGGTRLGDTAAEWVQRQGSNWLSETTTVLVVSDGWDAGDPAVLADALRAMRKAGSRILWVHPWLGTPGFELKTRALLAARPYVTRMYPGHSVPDLLRVAWE